MPRPTLQERLNVSIREGVPPFGPPSPSTTLDSEMEKFRLEKVVYFWNRGKPRIQGGKTLMTPRVARIMDEFHGPGHRLSPEQEAVLRDAYDPHRACLLADPMEEGWAEPLSLWHRIRAALTLDAFLRLCSVLLR